MSKRIKIFILLSSLLALYSFGECQTLQRKENQSQSFQQKYQQAINAERLRQPENALKIYLELLEEQAGNTAIRHRIKALYISQQKWPELERFFTDWQKIETNNSTISIELGWIKTHTGKSEEAKQIWRQALAKTRQKEQIARSIFLTCANYPGDMDGEAVMDFLRTELNSPLILAADYLAWLIERQHWESAFFEITSHLDNPAFPIEIVKARLFRLPAKNPLSERLISHYTSGDISIEAAKLTADLLYHGGHHNELAAFVSANISKISAEQVFTFAQGLHLQKHYGASEIISKAALHSLKNPELLSKTLFILAANYEQQFREALPRTELIPQPFQNELTQIDFFPYSAEEAELIFKAISLYDSLAALYGNTAQEARYRIGEIRFNIFNDFDQARRDFLLAAEGATSAIKLQAIKRLIDVEIASGNRQAAWKILKEAPEKYRLPVADEDALILKQIQMNYLFGETDSLQKNIYTALALLGENHLLYNDLLNFAALTKVILADSEHRKIFLQGENELHQNRLSQAKERFSTLMRATNPLYAIAAMRHLDILRSLGEKDMEELFWNEHYSALLNGPYADYFTVRYGEYLEFIVNDNPRAIEHYTDFLLAFPQSSYYETLRLHARKLIQLQSGQVQP